MIKYIYGTVNSGKTLSLLSSYMDTLISQNTVFYKSELSEPYGFITSSKTKMRKQCRVFDDKFNFFLDSVKADVIFIDDAHLLTDAQARQLILLSDEFLIDIRLYGLFKDFQGKTYKSVIELMSNEKTSLFKIEKQCENCGSQLAYNNAKVSDRVIIMEGKQDNDSKYMALCDDCYRRGWID